MNLQEHIRKVLKEETKIPNLVLRRLNLVDDMFNNIKNRYSRLFCRYKNPKILLGVLYERTLSDLYHAWFYEMVSEDEWGDTEKNIKKYLIDKFEKSTITHWENKCNKPNPINETKIPPTVLRRLHFVDDEVEMRFRTIYTIHNICRFESGEELLEVITDASIDSMYWNYFSNMDDNSKEWGIMYRTMLEYINDKYGDKIKEYYHINCGD